jgi:phage/plasmid-associated DNA primase
MFIASNHVVKFNTRDDALLNRVSLVKFPIQFLPGDHVPEEYRRDDGLKDKLLDERSGILNWIIWGMKYFLTEGIEATQAIIDNRREIQAAGSTALQWIAEMVEEGWLLVLDESEASATAKSHFIGVNEAYVQYQVWAAQAGERRPLTRKFFSKDIQNRYGEAIHSGVTRLPRLVWTEQWHKRHTAPAAVDNGISF